MNDQGIPFLEYQDIPEVARRTISVRVASERVETFGFLLGREMSAIGEGHGEIAGRAEDPSDHWLAARSSEDWVAVVAVHDVQPGRGLGRLTLRVLSLTKDVGSGLLAGLVERVRRAESEAVAGTMNGYAWAAVIGPAGEWANLNERARHQFGGAYEWPGLTLLPLVTPYEGQARSGALYREHRVRAYGSVEAPTWEIAQRLADAAATRSALFLSLLLRSSVERRQVAASVVQGTQADLDRLYPVETMKTLGEYVSESEAVSQNYGASASWHEPQHIYKLPCDAPALWKATESSRATGSFWSALAAYRTAWQLRYEFPSFGFVALVTAVEALVDESTLTHCACCNQFLGLGRAFRQVIADHTGVSEASLKPFTNLAYKRRSKTLHTGALHGGELLSQVGRRGDWAPDQVAAFELREWDRLESLVARTLLSWLRRACAGRV